MDTVWLHVRYQTGCLMLQMNHFLKSLSRVAPIASSRETPGTFPHPGDKACAYCLLVNSSSTFGRRINRERAKHAEKSVCRGSPTISTVPARIRSRFCESSPVRLSPYKPDPFWFAVRFASAWRETRSVSSARMERRTVPATHLGQAASAQQGSEHKTALIPASAAQPGYIWSVEQ